MVRTLLDAESSQSADGSNSVQFIQQRFIRHTPGSSIYTQEGIVVFNQSNEAISDAYLLLQ